MNIEKNILMRQKVKKKFCKINLIKKTFKTIIKNTDIY